MIIETSIAEPARVSQVAETLWTATIKDRVIPHRTFHPELNSSNNGRTALCRLCLYILVLGSSLTPTASFAQAIPTISTGASPARPSVQEQRRLKAEQELKVEEHQRILGVMPDFNTSYIKDAEPLTPGQKFDLAAKGAFDPFTFVVSGIDAAMSQAENDFPAYRQGGEGYAKRFGASYADSFTSTMLGNAVFPMLLKQDPRYFRKATGTFLSRFWYAAVSEVKCKNDKGQWAPNYSNVLGNIAAGGISNLYYPPSDRGVALTFERAFTVTAEGAIGAVFVEFWPDISRRLFPRHAIATLP